MFVAEWLPVILDDISPNQSAPDISALVSHKTSPPAPRMSKRPWWEHCKRPVIPSISAGKFKGSPLTGNPARKAMHMHFRSSQPRCPWKLWHTQTIHRGSDWVDWTVLSVPPSNVPQPSTQFSCRVMLIDPIWYGVFGPLLKICWILDCWFRCFRPHETES